MPVGYSVSIFHLTRPPGRTRNIRTFLTSLLTSCWHVCQEESPTLWDPSAPNQISLPPLLPTNTLSKQVLINSRPDLMTTKVGFCRFESTACKTSHLQRSAPMAGTHFEEITVYFPSLVRLRKSRRSSSGIQDASEAIVWTFKLMSESDGYCAINY